MNVQYIVICFLGVAQGRAQWARFEKAFMHLLNDKVRFIYVPDHHPDWIKLTFAKVQQACSENPNAQLIQLVHSAGLATFLHYQNRVLVTPVIHPYGLAFIISPPMSILVNRVAMLIRLIYSRSVLPRNQFSYYLHSSLTRLGRLSELEQYHYQGPIYLLYGLLDVFITGGRSNLEHELLRLGFAPTRCKIVKNHWPLHNPLRWSPEKLAELIESFISSASLSGEPR